MGSRGAASSSGAQSRQLRGPQEEEEEEGRRGTQGAGEEVVTPVPPLLSCGYVVHPGLHIPRPSIALPGNSIRYNTGAY